MKKIILFIGNITLHFSERIIKPLVILTFLSLYFCNFAYAQYGTGDLPDMVTPLESNYTYDKTTKGHYFLMNYRGETIGDRSSYSFLFGGSNEVFRVCQNGTIAILGSRLGSAMYPSLNFYSRSRDYHASINCQGDNLNIIAKNVLKFRTNGTDAAKFDSGSFYFYNNIRMQKNNVVAYMGITSSENAVWIGSSSQHDCYLGAYNNHSIYMDQNTNVYIGLNATEAGEISTTLKNKYKLFVKKGVLAEDFAIAPQDSWADFVFNTDYKLRPLTEVAQFIKVNKHLPDVPSAKDVSENGYSQHDVNKALLQKVEELTLYAIELQKQIDALKAEKAK